MIATPQLTHPSTLLDIAFFGSSLVSAYWNGAATYYRGIIHALAQRGHRITFYEPDAFERQKHRDIDDPDWCRVVVYDPRDEREALRLVEQAAAAGPDVIVKASGVGVHDALLERAVPQIAAGSMISIFWDVDAPATLARVEGDTSDEFRREIKNYDLVLTYGGGEPVVSRYTRLGARACHPIYNALDPATHFPVDPDPRYAGDLGFLGNRLPDRESRVDEFFLRAASLLPDRHFLLGGSGWDDKPLPGNVRNFGHVYTRDHNAFNCTPLAVLNISRDSMAKVGFSPATRVFEAAGAGACIITDEWEGIEMFLEPGRECLVARNAEDVARHIRNMDMLKAATIGDLARRRMLREHTYQHRAAEFERVLEGHIGIGAAGGGRGRSGRAPMLGSRLPAAAHAASAERDAMP